MATILGLDVGANSVGWALMEEDKRIIDMGVRIFPVGVKEDDFAKNGSEVSKNAARRTARGARRLNDRYKIRRKQLKRILGHLGMAPEETANYTAAELYGLRAKALDKKITLQEIGRIFLLLNQRRGFKSNRKDAAKGGDAAKELSETLQKMSDLQKKVKESNCRTIGEYFYTLFKHQPTNWRNPDEPAERIRKRFVYRAMYEEEFDAIWNKQREFYPDVFTDENYKRIKNDCIFFQRRLKSAKHLVAHCRFEPSKQVCPRSAFSFQEFRIWQTLGNIRVTTADHSRFRDPLNLKEKNTLADALQNTDKLTIAGMKKILGLDRAATINLTEGNDEDLKEIKGNKTYAALSNALGKEYFTSLPEDDKQKLWHTLYFADSNDWLKKYAVEKLGLTEEQAGQYTAINLESDYGSMSAKAIAKILPYMKQGFDYAAACEKAGYHHSYDEEKDSKDRVLIEFIKRARGDEIDQLRSPLVQRAVGETIRIVNAVIKEYGKPDMVRIEMARSFKKPKGERELMKRKNDDRNRLRDEYRAFLRERLGMNAQKSDILKFELWLEMEHAETDLQQIGSGIDINEFKKFAENVNAKDKEKFRLWLECGRISPYTGKIIPLSKLFSPEIQVEHILPYSKCMDDSFLNKTLCEQEFNEKKGNQTPYQYFKSDPAGWNAFRQRIKHLPGPKQEKLLAQEFPDDFQPSALESTAWIAKEIRKEIKTAIRDVRVVNGVATSILRREWGLSKILSPDGLNEKSRDDHRHHAIDALVIANTSNRYIQLLARDIKFDYRGRWALKGAPFPYRDFRNDAERILNEMFVSYRNEKRLLASKKNTFKHWKERFGAQPAPQKTIAARGALHEETYYGQIQNPHTGETNFVTRWPLEKIKTIKQAEKIVDPAIRETIKKYIATNGSNAKTNETSDNCAFMVSKKGIKIPIKTVRMINPASNMIQLRSNFFAESGNNYLIAIYENHEEEKKGKKVSRSYEAISFFDAAQRKKKNLPLFPPAKDGKKLLYALMQNESVVKYENHPDEIDWNNQVALFNRLYILRKISATNGVIFFSLHNYANVNTSHPKEYPKGVVWTPNCNTIKAVKVTITPLGDIIRQ